MMNKMTRVMIIEDDVRASYTLESTVNQHEDFEVVAVSENCQDALTQFILYEPHLVFVDITLPDGNGMEVMRQLRERNVDCHFIMTTAVRETSTIAKAVQIGVIDYLVKPIRMSRVTQALDDYVQYTKKLDQQPEFDQDSIDQLLGKTHHKTIRRTPKGIDETTLSSLKRYIETHKIDNFSADEIGEMLNFSRITARRYLEYLESEGLLKLVLDYNTGGRPKRLYHVVKPE